MGKLFGSKAEKDIKELTPVVEKIKKFESEFSQLSNDELRAKTAAFKAQIAQAIKEEQDQIAELKAKAASGTLELDETEALFTQIDDLEKTAYDKSEKVLEELLPQAFAVVKETAKRFTENQEIEVTATAYDRDLAAEKEHISIQGDQAIWQNSWDAAGAQVTWNMVHFDVQLIGGTVLHQGKIAEMQTGEGKTLVATLPVYLNALTGKGVHLVTVNDYLAKRDSEWMAPLFQFHGLTVDCIDKHQPNSPERKAAYRADITYGTNNEFGFDYLRDNMAQKPEDRVQPGHNYAIVDEVDSVLIDDARTPLIISGPVPRSTHQEFNALKPVVDKLVSAQRKLVTNILSDAKKKINEDEKEGGFLLLRAFRGLPKNKALIKFLSEQGMKALLQKTENIYLQDQSKRMPEVDEVLYFTIDEKTNSIELTERGVDLISGEDDKDFFVMPDVGAEIASLEASEISSEEKAVKKDELMRDFSVKSERIHTMNQLLKAYTLFEKDVEYVVMDSKVKIVDEQTGRIMEGRRYSDGLHQAIEAKENVKIEGATQTFATITLQNYFRMYNKLSGMTGTAETEAGEFWEIYELDVVVIPTNKPIARNDHQDKVFKTKREKYNAIIDEVVELSQQGRAILVGTTSVEVSELLSKMLNLRKIKHNVLNAKLHQREAEIVAVAGQPGTVTIATNMAGRGTDIKLSPEVKEAGGLAIIGTERHDSRRVDRQLRGRAGRQGDPGSSQFFVALEDNLMRLFGSDRVAGLMDRMGLEEGEVIQHSMISKSIERAQKKVEENNFGIRKRLLEYDDVMNAQREVIYKRRHNALDGDRLAVDIANMLYDTAEDLVATHQEAKEFEDFKLDLLRTFSIDAPFSEQEFLKESTDVLVDKLYSRAVELYKSKADRIAEMAFPVIKNVYEQQAGTYENIVVPFTDGLKSLQVVANLEDTYQSEAKSLMRAFEKGITLAIIDDNWKEHLREMDDLKQAVQGAVYEQKDPLLIYKFESFNLFKAMMNNVNREIVSFLFKGNLPSQDSSQVKQAQQPQAQQNLKASRPDEIASQAAAAQQGRPGAQAPRQPERKPEPVKAAPKVGRNDPCPCGSGKKYKQCHGKAQ